MKQLVLQNNVIATIDQYIYRYIDLFQSLYSDTGLYGIEQILDAYTHEGDKRRQEISDILEQRLAPDIILGRTPLDTIFLPWRSKTLWISWEDDGDTRIVRDLIIR